MNNIVFDFRRNYVRGERLESQEIVYQYDEGRVIEAYVPEQEGFVLNVGFESDATLYVVEVDSTTADDEGGYKVLATLPDTFLTRHGNLLVYVIAGEDEMIVTTYEGVIPVRPKAVSEDYVEPTEEETSILARCAAAANASETAQGVAEAKALVAEGYALGTQDGTPVSSGTYYQNNAKYHELEAEGYAVGKQDGTDVSSGSPYYHNNAKYYAEQTAESLNGVLWQTDIVDNATTSDTTKVPSAAVAKSLQDQIGTVPSGSTLQGQIDTLNSKISNTCYADHSSVKTYTIPLTGFAQGNYWMALMYASTSYANYGLYLIFMDVNNDVSVTPLVLNSGRTFTGTRSGNNLVLTANDTVWGGIRVIMMN